MDPTDELSSKTSNMLHIHIGKFYFPYLIHFCFHQQENNLIFFQNSVTISPTHNRLYWTDWKIGSIHTHDLITNETREVIDSPEVPLVLHVWDERLQPSGDNPCKHKNGNCSHLCLLSNSTAGFICMGHIYLIHLFSI